MSWSPAQLAGFDDYVRTRATAHLRTAFLLTGNRSDAEDLVQTVLAKLAVRWSRVQQLESPEAYVRRSLVNAQLSSRRRRRVATVSIPELPEPAQPTTDPVDRLLLWSSLQQLPARQRAAVVLRFWEDLTERETAEVLGCSVGTVKSQTSKALAKLRADSGLQLLNPQAQEAGRP